MEIRQKPSNEDAKLWRYLDFTKLVSLLETQSLFFVRADKFEDPYEGSYPKLNREDDYRPVIESMHQLVLNEISKHQGNQPDFEEILSVLRHAHEPNDYAFLSVASTLLKKAADTYQKPLFDEMGDDLEVMFNALNRLVAINKELRELNCISCWHMNESESVAMWKMYLKSNEGVAIQTSYKNLVAAFGDVEEEMVLGPVNYIDYETEDFHESDKEQINTPFFYKRRAFEFEREFRAVITSGIINEAHDGLIPNPFGKAVPVDLDILIENVYVSPMAPDWFLELVESVMTKYGINKKTIRSRLIGTPIL